MNLNQSSTFFLTDMTGLFHLLENPAKFFDIDLVLIILMAFKIANIAIVLNVLDLLYICMQGQGIAEGITQNLASFSQHLAFFEVDFGFFLVTLCSSSKFLDSTLISLQFVQPPGLFFNFFYSRSPFQFPIGQFIVIWTFLKKKSSLYHLCNM